MSKGKSGNAQMKEFFTPFLISDGSNSGTGAEPTAKGTFRYVAYDSRKALIQAKQQSGAIVRSLPEEYRNPRFTVRLLDQVHTSLHAAEQSIAGYRTKLSRVLYASSV
jgi:hypothetical protein